ncbi:hypothetical protein QFC21_005104 [Naganishia friedmannii]|uniref:Uncharacterized protein n=1 Tax=Naganishia friedmannii TaxID=89922 RepID=A0ACC2VBS8_9TREE|nr:hypothetical protein QFC21_005104 [Naganishia friedmannii]
MALPASLERSLTPQELTFISEQQEIEIVPSFSMTKIRLVSRHVFTLFSFLLDDLTACEQGVYGPFEPPRRATVPLWLALSLKRKKKCRIIPPDWLSPEILNAMVAEEMNEKHGLWPDIPRYLFETAKVLLDVAPNDLPEAAQIRSLLLSLRHLRLSKIRSALRPPPPSGSTLRDPYNNNNNNAGGGGGQEDEEPDTGAFSGRGEYMSLTGFTPLEVVQMRGMFTGVLKVVGKLSGGVDEEVGGAGGGEGDAAGAGATFGGEDDEDEDDMDMDRR